MKFRDENNNNTISGSFLFLLSYTCTYLLFIKKVNITIRGKNIRVRSVSRRVQSTIDIHFNIIPFPSEFYFIYFFFFCLSFNRLHLDKERHSE